MISLFRCGELLLPVLQRNRVQMRAKPLVNAPVRTTKNIPDARSRGLGAMSSGAPYSLEISSSDTIQGTPVEPAGA